MTQDITQLRIGKYYFGIVGLFDAISNVAETNGGEPDEVIAGALFDKLSETNYLPENAKELYKQAFLKEYQKQRGLAVTVPDAEKDDAAIMIIGQGCAQCDKLEMDVISMLSSLKIAARVEHVRDVKTIARMGVISVPALMINGKVKCAGSAPAASQLRRWIEECVAADKPKKQEI